MISFFEHEDEREDRAAGFGDGELDEEFPLGDGTAETESIVMCPYCGEENDVALDPGSGAHQQYVEDCQVCCRPWYVTVRYDSQGDAYVTAVPIDEC
jgi:hypothetical protein